MRYYTFFPLDMLKVIVDFLTLMIGAESEAPRAQINNQV
jgi:hypothetical protein